LTRARRTHDALEREVLAPVVTLLWSHRLIERRKQPTGLVSTTGYGVWAVCGWPCLKVEQY